MKKIFFCCIITAIILSTSCKNNESEPPIPIPVSGAYFTTGKGSSWVYSNYSLTTDTSGKIVETKLNENDTLTLLSFQNVLDKDAMTMRYHFVNTLTNTTSTSDYAMYEDTTTNRLFVNSEFMKILLPEMLQIGFGIFFNDNTWYKLADASATKAWILDSFKLTDAESPFDFYNFKLKLTGYVKFAIEKVKDTTIHTNPPDSNFSGDYNCNSYALTVYFDGTARTGNAIADTWISPLGTVRIEFSKVNFYFSLGKGLLGIKAPVHKVLVKPLNSNNNTIFTLTTLDGFEKRLIEATYVKKVPWNWN